MYPYALRPAYQWHEGPYRHTLQIGDHVLASIELRSGGWVVSTDAKATGLIRQRQCFPRYLLAKNWAQRWVMERDRLLSRHYEAHSIDPSDPPHRTTSEPRVDSWPEQLAAFRSGQRHRLSRATLGSVRMTGSLPNRLRRARRGASLTQEQLAERLGINRSAVAQWERASHPTRPQLDHLIRIATMTHVSFEWLATGRMKSSPLTALRATSPFEVRCLQALRLIPATHHPLVEEFLAALRRKRTRA